MKSIVKRISRLFGNIVLVATVLAGGLSVPMTATAGPAMCPATLDVVLVFDRSASMAYDDPFPDPQPLGEAQDATVAFIDMFDGDDAVGLVDFADGATTTNHLTFTHSDVRANVELDWLDTYTNTGAGIDAGHAELTVNGRDGVKKVIVLLSDGKPTRPIDPTNAATYALDQAGEAKADDIVIYAIGFGSSTSATSTFMQGVASDPSNYYYAPTSAGLEDIYEEIASEVCQPDIVTLTASKIVCENESLLPDWSGQSINITDTTATDYVAAIQGCSLESGWSFQWGDQTVSDPGGDYYGEVIGDGWTTFGPTNVDGVATTSIDIAEMTQISVREVLQSGYIPFTYPPTDDTESAELYCSDDVYHYDNFDFITDLAADETYYCVAFNALEEVNTPPVITRATSTVYLTVGDAFDPMGGHATADDAEDGATTTTANMTASSSVNTAVAGTYYVDYNVTDLGGLDAVEQTLVVIVEEPIVPPHYGSYCGDGVVNQWWEECDSGDDPMIVGCSVRCQIMGAPVCSEDVFVRAVITDVQNLKTEADMTEDIFLGTSTLPIPNGTWFPVYYDGSYVNDDSIEGYEDVPGLAVQRDNGSVTVRHYGSHPSCTGQEHVEGYLEFYNAGVLGIANDTSDNNRMENWGPDMVAQKAVNAGKDAAWTSTTTSDFWMTVTTADDSYFTTYELPPECIQCSVEGHKYNYDTGEGIADWTIGLAEIQICENVDDAWADYVVDYSPVGTIGNDRDDPDQALGATDYNEANGTYNFVSLGMGGELILGFNNLILNLNGVDPDLEVVETSWDSPTCDDYPEKAKVYASQDGSDGSWEYIGQTCLDGTFDLGSLPWAKYIKIVDVTVDGENGYSGDGYNVDAVKALYCGNYETVMSTTTDTFGEYCFADVATGTYAVYEEMQSNWHIMEVTVGNIPADYHIDSFFDVFVEIEVETGTTTIVDFYNQEDEVPVTNEPPVAVATATPMTVILGNSIGFDGTGSYDTDGTIVSYSWSFGDTTTGAGATTTHTYTATGTYSVVLTVTDNDVDTDTDTVEITVIPTDVPPICENVIVVSNTDDMVVCGSNAMETFVHSAWTLIEDATWIWESYYVQMPAASETVNFTKDFEIIGIPATTTLTVAADNTYTVWINSTEVGSDMDEDNYSDTGKDIYTDISDLLQTGTNTIAFEVMNIEVSPSTPESNPAGLLYRLEIEIEGDSCLNNAPEITLAYSTLYLTVGDSFDAFDGHATTSDPDGDDVTLYASSTVDTNATGTYAVVYTAEDEHGAWATPQTLTVIVEEGEVNNPPVITLAASTLYLTVGDAFDPMDGHATTTDVDGDDVTLYASSTVDTNATGTYAVVYTAEDEHGAEATPKTLTVIVGEGAPVDYPECSDGEDNDGDGDVDIDDLTCYRDGEYDPEIDDEENQKPVITLINSTINLTVGSSFDPYGGHASADDVEDGDITADIVATSTVNTSAVGTYTVDYGVEDSEGLKADPKILTVIVTQVSGGGGGGGGGYIPQFLTITNEKVQYLGSGEAKVTWKTNLPATSQVVYGDEPIVSVGSAPSYGYDSMNVEDTGLVTSHSMTITGLEDGKQYWFRPVSDRSFSAEKYGREVTYTFVTVSGQCNYLLEYIQMGAANNPVEVEKLERFLNDFEGENLEVNGIYEQADFDAVLRFQTKYFGDILGPWGHDAPTGYVYITTKKKINELYCEREFPLTLFQETEIAAFSAFLSAQSGISVGIEEDREDIDFSNVVGLGDDEDEDTTLADATDATDDEEEDAGNRGLLAGILNAFGFGDDDEDTLEKSDPTDPAEDAELATEDEIQGQGERNLAAVVLGGVMSVATSYWFIFLLAVFAIILFLRIRGAEKS